MLEDASFFFKLHQISRYYIQFSKLKAKEFKKDKLDTRARLRVASTILYEDIYDAGK